MSSNEKIFLQELGKLLTKYAEEVRALEGKGTDVEKMHALLNSAIEHEKILRQKYDIGVRFHVLRSQLQATLDEFEKELATIQQQENSSHIKNNLRKQVAEDETLVYVYLFNSNGNKIKTWENLLLPSALQDHSVNRPIYTDLAHAQEVLRTRFPKDQHAYFEAIVKKSDILTGEEEITDNYQHPLVRLKEGALTIDRLRRFHHKNQDYRIENGELI
jgi:hypothetical protein